MNALCKVGNDSGLARIKRKVVTIQPFGGVAIDRDDVPRADFHPFYGKKKMEESRFLILSQVFQRKFLKRKQKRTEISSYVELSSK